MSPSDPDGEIAKSSLGYACKYLHVGGCISAIATEARKCQGKTGENITTVYLRVLLKELEEKHSTTGDSCCAGKGICCHQAFAGISHRNTCTFHTFSLKC